MQTDFQQFCIRAKCKTYCSTSRVCYPLEHWYPFSLPRSAVIISLDKELKIYSKDFGRKSVIPMVSFKTKNHSTEWEVTDYYHNLFHESVVKIQQGFMETKPQLNGESTICLNDYINSSIRQRRSWFWNTVIENIYAVFGGYCLS